MQVTKIISAQLQRAENIIEQGVIAYRAAGGALRDIRDSGLYKDSHSTFEEYCKDRWGWERAYAYRLIDAAKISENCLPMGDIPNERQARELTKLPTAELQKAAYGVAETIAEQNKAGKVTAKDVKKAVEIVHQVIQDNPSIKPEDIAAKAVENGATTGLTPHHTPAPADTAIQPDEDDGAPSEEEISNAIKEHDEEIESMRRVCESDDKIAGAMSEAKRYREQLRIIESRNNGLMGELSAAKKKIASLERKIAKIEKIEKDAF